MKSAILDSLLAPSAANSLRAEPISLIDLAIGWFLVSS